jgi:carbonic anhydrase
MVDVVYRFGGDPEADQDRPATAEQAQELLEAGNRDFRNVFDPDRDDDQSGDHHRHRRQPRGGGGTRRQPPAHAPFAAVVSCADARVPVELVFGRAVNDLFVLRVAGNVLGAEVIGSLDYAFQALPSVRTVVVLGHSSCGAVTAAVDAYLNPASYLGLAAEHQLRGDRRPAVPGDPTRPRGHAAHLGCRDAGAGNRGSCPALVDTSIALNAALMASTLRRELVGYGIDEVAPRFAVYDLVHHGVGTPAEGADGSPLPGSTSRRRTLRASPRWPTRTRQAQWSRQRCMALTPAHRRLTGSR